MLDPYITVSVLCIFCSSFYIVFGFEQNLLELNVFGFLVSQSGPKSSTGGKKAGTPNPLTPAAKMDHSVVGHTLMDIVAPRLAQEVSDEWLS